MIRARRTSLLVLEQRALGEAGTPEVEPPPEESEATRRKYRVLRTAPSRLLWRRLAGRRR